MRTLWFYSGYTLYNAATGLNLDVQGNSYWGGAEIDVWYRTARSTRSSARLAAALWVMLQNQRLAE